MTHNPKQMPVVHATRAIERELLIDAVPERVWEALTSAELIGGWFAPLAEVRPGIGGALTLGWDVNAPGDRQRCEITTWEPERRLVMNWREAGDGEHPLPVDITLTAQDGGTLLRLVHSGFLSDADWDEEFDSHGRGWSYELRSLKHYVEQHFGQPRSAVMMRIGVGVDDWPRWIGPAGMFKVADLAGEAVELLLGLPTGQESKAKVLSALSDRDFAAMLDVLNGGVLRLAFETFSGVPEIWLWTFSWQHGEAELARLVAPWFDAVRARVESA